MAYPPVGRRTTPNGKPPNGRVPAVIRSIISVPTAGMKWLWSAHRSGRLLSQAGLPKSHSGAIPLTSAGYHYIGLDISLKMMAQLRERLPPSKSSGRCAVNLKSSLSKETTSASRFSR